MRTRRPAARWGFCFGLLALLIQVTATALPMPAAAGVPGVPAWLAASLCQSAPDDGPGGHPAPPAHLICPVCFVLSAAAPPTQPSTLVTPLEPQPIAAPAIPRALGGKRQHAGFVSLSRAPPSV